MKMSAEAAQKFTPHSRMDQTNTRSSNRFTSCGGAPARYEHVETKTHGENDKRTRSGTF